MLFEVMKCSKIACGDGCIPEIYEKPLNCTLKCTNCWYMNYTSVKLLPKKKLARPVRWEEGMALIVSET